MKRRMRDMLLRYERETEGGEDWGEIRGKSDQ